MKDLQETAAEHEADSLNDAAKSDALNDGIRYCRACRHFQPSVDANRPAYSKPSIEYSKCSATKELRRSLVSPELDETFYQYCYVARMPGFTCGPEGKLWELRSVVELTERFRSESGIE